MKHPIIITRNGELTTRFQYCSDILFSMKPIKHKFMLECFEYVKKNTRIITKEEFEAAGL